jgi:hypothetical protein
LMALAKFNPSGAGAEGGSTMTAGTIVLQYSSSAAVLDHLVGGACATCNSGKRGPLNCWLRVHGRRLTEPRPRDEPSAAVPPIVLPARPMGNPAADPVVTHPSSVVLELGCCLPGQAGSPCTPPPPAIPHPPVSRVPATPALAGARPRAGSLPASAAATPAIPFPPPRAPSSPMGFKNRVERDPNRASHAATN